jgi:hypothetical protein
MHDTPEMSKTVEWHKVSDDAIERVATIGFKGREYLLKDTFDFSSQLHSFSTAEKGANISFAGRNFFHQTKPSELQEAREQIKKLSTLKV